MFLLFVTILSFSLLVGYSSTALESNENSPISKLTYIKSKAIRDNVEYNKNEKEFSKKDNQPVIDIYKDSSDKEYYFFTETDKLCGFKTKEYYSTNISKEEMITENRALEIANDYLIDTIEEFNEYELSSIKNEISVGVYDILYTKKYCGYESNNIINIYITTKGEIGAFSAFNINTYKNYIIEMDNIKYEKVKNEKIKDFLNLSANNEEIDCNVNHEIISIHNDGILYTDLYLELKHLDGSSEGIIISIPFDEIKL